MIWASCSQNYALKERRKQFLLNENKLPDGEREIGKYFTDVTKGFPYFSLLLKYIIFNCPNSLIRNIDQARIQEFQNGGARSRRGRILRSKVCFDASLHIPYVFVRRVVNNIHILNTACWLKSKYLRIYNENLPKKVPFFFSNGGGARPARRSWIRLCILLSFFQWFNIINKENIVEAWCIIWLQYEYS